MTARTIEAVDTSAEEAIEDVRDPAPAATTPKDDEEMPLPTEPRTIFLGGLFLLAVLAALYVAAPIILPVVLAIVLKLLLQPLVRLLDRVGVPRGLGALVAILILVVALAGIISGVAGPAASWAGKLPDAIPQIQQQLAFLTRPIESFQWMMSQIQGVGGVGVSLPQGSSEHSSVNVMGMLFSGTTTLNTQLLQYFGFQPGFTWDVSAFQLSLASTGGGGGAFSGLPFATDIGAVPTPEPSTLLLLGTGFLALARGVRRSRRKGRLSVERSPVR